MKHREKGLMMRTGFTFVNYVPDFNFHDIVSG